MGYREQPQTIKLKFAPDDKLYGLEVRLRGLSIGEYLKLTGLDGSDGEGIGGGIQRFAESLIEWNLEDADGQPIPTTLEAVQQRDKELILRLATAWLDAVNGVHEGDPLPASSPGGEPSLVASIPTETLSPSLAS